MGKKKFLLEKLLKDIDRAESGVLPVDDSEMIPSQQEDKGSQDGDKYDPHMEQEDAESDENDSTTQDPKCCGRVSSSDDDSEIIPSQHKLQQEDKGSQDGDEYDPHMEQEDAESDENDSTTQDPKCCGRVSSSDDDSEIIPSQHKLQQEDKGSQDGDEYDPHMEQEDAESNENDSTTQDTKCRDRESGLSSSDDDSEIIPRQHKLQQEDNGSQDGDKEDAESDENDSTTQDPKCRDRESGVSSSDDSEIIPSQHKLQQEDKGSQDGDKYDPHMEQEDAESDENDSTTQDAKHCYRESGVSSSDDDSEIIPSQHKLQQEDKDSQDGDEYDPHMEQEDAESDENDSTTQDPKHCYRESGVSSSDDSEIIPSQHKLQQEDKGSQDGDEYDPHMEQEDAESDENDSTTQDPKHCYRERGVSSSDDDSEIIPSQHKLQQEDNGSQEDAESDENDSTTQDAEHVSDDENDDFNECYLSDMKNPKVFTKKHLQNQNANSKSGRTYDRRHSCSFCGNLMTNIQTHYEHAHKNCKEVKEMYELKLKIDATTGEEKKMYKSILKKQQTLLRNKGNDKHNTNVCKRKRGEIILSRRRNSETFECSKYGPCPHCREWILFALFSQHKRTCVAIDRDKHAFETTGTVIQGKILKGQITTKPSKLMAKEVFPSMKDDQQTEVAQNDDLIVAIGELWLMKNFRNRLRRKNFTSFRMRLCARLLLLLRETYSTEDSMKVFLAPNYFDAVVSCALKACNLNQDEELQNPSVAIKLGYDVARLASAKLGFSIKQSDENGKREATDFLKLLQLEWSVKVSKTARTLLEERHFNKARLLPIPNDIVELASYLVQQLKTIDPTPEEFREVVVLTETRLLLYNRRRPGELESITVDAYKNRSTTLDETETALRNLTKVEKTLINNQDMIEIRGKTGRGVPLLVPSETRKTLKFLSNPEKREKAGVKEDNKFLFANTGSTVVRAGSALDEVKSRLPLKAPDRILATNLRKHTATIAQVMSLNEQEMKNLCRHLGHTQKVHDQFYKQTSGMVERIDIAKLMLVQEYNLTSKYAGKTLEDIQLEEIFDDIADVADANTVEHNQSAPDVLTVDEDASLYLDPKRKKTKRTRWDAKEMEELQKYLPEYFQESPKQRCPSKSECQFAVTKSSEENGKIWKRGWETIKKKVNNMLMSRK